MGSLVKRGRRSEKQKKSLYASSKLALRLTWWRMATNGGSMGRKGLKVGLIPGMVNVTGCILNLLN